jgi:spermidine/putrescine transport system substrate-binding protein
MKKKVLGQRKLCWLAGIACAALLIWGPSAMAEEKIEGPLVVESWGGSYAEAVKNFIIDPFKAKYGIEVIHSFFGNNSEQLAKLQAGKTEIDVSFLSQNFAFQAMQGGLSLPIRIENVPNYQNLFDKFKHPPYDPGPQVFCISYFWGDQALAWNTKFVETPTSWGALWDPRYKGRVALYSTGTQVIPSTAMYLGQDPNNITDLDAVMAKLKELKPNLLKFWSSGAEMTSLFATGEVWIADFWRGRVNNLIKDGHPIAYGQPKEGSIGWVDTMIIPKGAKHRRAAEAFLDFALSKEVHTNFVTKGITYAPCSNLVELTAEQTDMLGASPQLRKNVVFIDPNYQTKNRDAWNSLMNELMAGQ